VVQRKFNPKTGKPYFLSEPSGPGSNYTGKISGKLDPKYDDQQIDIFEGGPAGQVLKDIDPFYGGIQLQEDELLGSQGTRDLARFTKGVTEYLAPSDETIAAQEEQRAKNQQIFNVILNAAGLEPDSFEANQLYYKLIREDQDFLDKLGFDQGSMLTGGGTTDKPTYGLFDIGNFFFGDARRGLTEMTEEGTKYKELPIEQKLGIAILPIDLIDVGGLAYLLKTPLGAFMRAGQKAFGKGSKLTVKELSNNKEFVQNYLKENPNAAEALEEYGIDIRDMTVEQQRQQGVGADINPKILKQGPVQPEIKQKPLKPKTKKDIEAEEIRKTAQSLEGTFEGRQAVDPFQLTVNEFAKDFNRVAGLKSFKVKKGEFLDKLKKQYGEDYDNLYSQAVSQKLIDPKAQRASANVDLGTPVLNELKKLDFKNLDPKTDVIGDIVRKERKRLGLPEYNPGGGKGGSELDIINRLGREGRIPKTLMNKIKKFQDKRQKLGRDAATEAATLARQKKAKKRAKVFREVIADIQKDKDYDIIFNANQIIPLLKAKDPKLFSATYKNAGARRKVLDSMIAVDPGLDQYINKTGYIPDPETFLITPDQPKQQNIFAQKFIEKFRPGESYVEALNKDHELRFFNNLRRSQDKSAEDFFETVKLEDIQEGGDKYEDFLKFQEIDKVRLRASEELQPILKKIFDAIRMDLAVKRGLSGEGLEALVFDSRSSMQLAHRFKLSGITEGFAADKIGKGAKAEEIYLDISDYNSYIQNGLEREARDAYNMFEKTQDPKFRAIFDAVDQDMRILGIEGQVAPGVKVGKAKPIDQKISELIINVMNKFDLKDPKKGKGLLTQAELDKADELATEIAEAKQKYEKMFGEPANYQSGGLVKDVEDIFEEEDQIMGGQIMPRISIEFGDAAKGTARRFGEEKPEDMVSLPLSEIQLGDSEPVERTSAEPQEKMFDVQPTENIFTGEMEQANLKFPFWKLFTQPPKNETAPIPTPKESLDNPTKKQKESLELEKEKTKDQPPLDPTPEDDVPLTDDVMGMDIAVTPKSQTPITGVFYSDIERVLSRPDTPAIFPNKKALLDFLKKNRIRDSEFRDYQIDSLLRVFDENTPIPKAQVIEHLRQAPIRGMHVHATGQFSEVINPNGAVDTRYPGYAESGFIDGTQRERVLYIPTDKFPGDSGTYPSPIFQGEKIENHKWGMPNQDNAYVIGWTRLTDRMAILPTKIAAPKSASNIPGLERERKRAQRQVAGLFAEAINKLNREGVRRGMSQGDLDELSQLSLEQIMTQYAGTLNEISPGLLDQIDELIVKVRDIDDQITKGSTVDTSGIVKVTFADEIQSDIMQAAAGRKQKLLATLRKIADEGRESTTLPELSRIGNDALAFFEENKSVFRPLRKSQTEVDIIGDRLAKLDAEVDDIINRYIETRELDPASVKRLKEALNENINNMIDELMQIDTKTYDGLFPDLPFKKREEWADALIKKDLFELAYRKFILKDPNVPDYYAVSPQELVINRYSFKGDSSTPLDVRAADKKRQIDYFMARGEFTDSEYKGVGMSEFYGGPNAKDPNGKHYTSTIEKILKTQAKQNNSEFVVLNVQTKSGSKDLYRITDQNGNMVATLSNRNQAETVVNNNPNYRMETVSMPTDKNTTPSFAIKITEEMLEPYKTHKAKGGLVSMIDIFEVA